MRLPAAFALFAALATAGTLTLASCGGGGDAKLLPGATAREITENLSLVREYAAERECVGAADAATEVSAQVEALENVDPKLKQALQRGAAKLGEVVADCEEASEVETSEGETTKPERREPPGQEKKAEKEREREEKASEKEEGEEGKETPPGKEPPAEPPSTPPDEGGGTPAPGGVSPGQPIEPGGE